MEQLPKQEWTPRPIGSPEAAATEFRPPTPLELDFANTTKEVLDLIDDIDGLFDKVNTQLNGHLEKINIIPDPKDDALNKALDRFGSPGVITKAVIDHALTVLSVPPNGLLPVDATSEQGPQMFVSAAGMYENCASYAQNISDFFKTGIGLGTGNNNLGIEGVAGANRAIQELGRVKALKMIFLGIMRSIIDMIAGVLKPFKYTPVGFVVNKILSWLRKKLKEGERSLAKADPIGKFAHKNDSSERYEVWTKLEKVTWVGIASRISYEYEMWVDDNGTPYQKSTDVPKAKIIEYLTKADPDPSSPKTNITQSRMGWTGVVGDYMQSVSVFPISLLPLLPATLRKKYDTVVKFIVVDTNTYYMDQNDWTVKLIPVELDPDLQATVAECTANAMAIVSAADTYHLYSDSSAIAYPNQAYMTYRTIGSVSEGYQATKAITQSMLTAGYESLYLVGGDGVAKRVQDFVQDTGAYVDRKVTGPAKRQLESLLTDYNEFVKGLPDDKYARSAGNILSMNVRLDFIKMFLVDLKTALQILTTELENWLNDRTILCCFVRDLYVSGRKWRPLIKLLRLMLVVLKNKGRQQQQLFLNATLDLAYLLYNTAVDVILAVLETLMNAGLSSLKNWLTEKLSIDKKMEERTKKWECLPFKAFSMGLLAGIDLAGDDLLQYLKDMLARQRSAIKDMEDSKDIAKQCDWMDHLDKLLAALENMMTYEINCVNGVAVHPSLPISDILAQTGGGGDADPAMAAQLAALRAIGATNTALPSSDTTMSIDQLVSFYRSYMHYTPDQIAYAFTSDASSEQVKQLTQFMPQETAEMMGVETCLQKLTPAERAEAESRIQQLQQLSSEGA